MSLTIQQILVDAKRLSSRLKERGSEADDLLIQTGIIAKKIEAMKRFQEEIDELNEASNQKPHSELITNIQKENRHLREIRQENRELRAAIEDYQRTLEVIMSKYRKHTSAEIYKSKIDLQSIEIRYNEELVEQQARKIEEMTAVMERAAQFDGEELKFTEAITKLRKENKELREILCIANKHGNNVQNTGE